MATDSTELFEEYRRTGRRSIRNRIVEEHMGEIAFLDRSGGGTHVRIAFDTEKLAALATENAPTQPDDNPDESEDEA